MPTFISERNPLLPDLSGFTAAGGQPLCARRLFTFCTEVIPTQPDDSHPKAILKTNSRGCPHCSVTKTNH